MTNADKIRNMKDEELAELIMCPYDTAGEEIMPCILEGQEPETTGECIKCITKWLKKDTKQEQSQCETESWKDHVMQRFTRSE